jgi:hypothetical protein
MTQPKNAGDRPVQCTCVRDAFAALPPELRPRIQKKSSLRKVTCPGCGLVYSTNRSTDLCMECENKGVEAP